MKNYIPEWLSDYIPAITKQEFGLMFAEGLANIAIPAVCLILFYKLSNWGYIYWRSRNPNMENLVDISFSWEEMNNGQKELAVQSHSPKTLMEVFKDKAIIKWIEKSCRKAKKTNKPLLLFKSGNFFNLFKLMAYKYLNHELNKTTTAMLANQETAITTVPCFVAAVFEPSAQSSMVHFIVIPENLWFQIEKMTEDDIHSLKGKHGIDYLVGRYHTIKDVQKMHQELAASSPILSFDYSYVTPT